MSLPEPFLPGRPKVKLKPLEQKEIIEDISSQVSPITKTTLNQKTIEEEYVTVESQQSPKKKTWKDRFNSLNENTQITRLSKILDPDSTLNQEKVLTPFWTVLSKEISQKLWLPTETDSVDSVLSSSKESSTSPMGSSWFSIEKKCPPKKNLSTTWSQLLPSSLLDSTVLDPTKL